MLGHRKLTTDEYIHLLKRRRVHIVIPAIAFCVLGIVATFFIKPRYLSQTLVIVDEQKVPDDYVKPILTANLDSRLSSMREQILSRTRIQPIIERYGLYATGRNTMDDRVDLARKAIIIKPIHSDISRAGGLPGFFVSFTANSPRVAQLVCAEITTVFLNENLRPREASAEDTTNFLKSQLADAKHNLDEQDRKLAVFQSEHFGKLPGEEPSNLNMLTSLNTQLEATTQALSRMEQDRSYQQSLLSQQAPSKSPDSPAADAALSARAQARDLELQKLLADEAELSSHYTAEYPDVVAVRRRIAELRKEEEHPASVAPRASSSEHRIPESLTVQQLRAQLQSADVGIENKRREQGRIQSQIQIYQERIESSPLVNEQYTQLTRDYETAQKFHDDLLTKMNHSKMANDLERRQEGEQFRILDAANLPDSPVFPKRWLFALGGLIFGLVLGSGLAAFIEYRDTALRSDRDVWAFTRLPTLAVLPYGGDQETQ